MKKPQLPALLTDFRANLVNHLRSYFDLQKQQASMPLVRVALERLSDMAGGGKMLRGVLVMIGFDLSDKKQTEYVRDAALAMELTHTALLIHDDIMDRDEMRRRGAAMHMQYAEDENSSLHYGESQAISVGDIALFMGMERLSKAVSGNEKSDQITALFANELMQVGYGQMHDVLYSQTDMEPTESDILDVYRTKTARYSFALPLLIGGMLAGLPWETLRFLADFGEATGVAFQIRDDELGIFGDEKTIGKPVGSDIRENKKTLLRSRLFAAATADELAKLKDIYGNETLSDDEIQYVRRLHEKYGVQESVGKLCSEYKNRTQKLIAKSPLDDTQQALFGEILDFTVGRTK